MTITIRRGESSDLETVQNLNKSLFDYEHSNGFYPDDSFNVNWPYEEAGTNYFKECLSPTLTSIVFMAETNGKPVGYIAGVYSNKAYRSKNPIAEIENMYVEEAYQHQGIGSRLVDTFTDWTKDNKVARIRVGAFAANEKALIFYRKCGFHELEIHLEN
jgi:GNAT superfamily N-acetyltransferase